MTDRPLDPTLLSPEIAELEEKLRTSVIGQDEAARELVDVVMEFTGGLSDPTRPVASLLFTGPSGSGKTLTAEVVSRALTAADDLIRIDCGTFQAAHEVAKLLGAPPGYLGHKETQPLITQGKLTAAAGKGQIAFVLFDEIEKAHQAFHDVLLGVMDKAALTLGDGQRVSFSRAVLLMTANVGSREIASAADGFGFGMPSTSTGTATRACRAAFKPEFLNRLTRTIVFRPLTVEHLRSILRIELDKVRSRLSTGPVPTILCVDDAACAALVTDGYEPRYGARHLARAVDTHVTRPLARMLSSRQIAKGDAVLVRHDGQYRFSVERH